MNTPISSALVNAVINHMDIDSDYLLNSIVPGVVEYGVGHTAPSGFTDYEGTSGFFESNEAALLQDIEVKGGAEWLHNLTNHNKFNLELEECETFMADNRELMHSDDHSAAESYYVIANCVAWYYAEEACKRLNDILSSDNDTIEKHLTKHYRSDYAKILRIARSEYAKGADHLGMNYSGSLSGYADLKRIEYDTFPASFPFEDICERMKDAQLKYRAMEYRKPELEVVVTPPEYHNPLDFEDYTTYNIVVYKYERLSFSEVSSRVAYKIEKAVNNDITLFNGDKKHREKKYLILMLLDLLPEQD